MKSTPLPLTVSAMITVGTSLSAGGSESSASTSFAMSWPSVSMTFQPKARHLSAYGSNMTRSSAKLVMSCRLRSITTTFQAVATGRHHGLPHRALAGLAVTMSVKTRWLRRAMAPRAMPTAREAVAESWWTPGARELDLHGCIRRRCRAGRTSRRSRRRRRTRGWPSRCTYRPRGPCQRTGRVPGWRGQSGRR
jgi:hypothetical protein